MKKALPLAILAAAALGLAFSVGGGGSPDAGNKVKLNAPFGYGQQIAGAWLVVLDFGNGPRDTVIQVSADGGMAGCNGLYINPDGSTSHLTTSFGSWKRIGPRAIATTTLVQIVSDDGSTKFYEKVISEVTIEGDEFSGEGAGLVYLPTQDPLDPDEVPVQILTGPMTGQRILVETLPE